MKTVPVVDDTLPWAGKVLRDFPLAEPEWHQ
jgi:hypothetical protein